jgi:hypothetical protein
MKFPGVCTFLASIQFLEYFEYSTAQERDLLDEIAKRGEPGISAFLHPPF